MDAARTKVKEIKGMRATILSTEGTIARTQLFRACLISLVVGIIGIGAGLISFWLARVAMNHQAREKAFGGGETSSGTKQSGENRVSRKYEP